MELSDLKEPISIIYLIRTLCSEAISQAFFDSKLLSLFEKGEINEDELIARTTFKRNELIEISLVTLDVALINLKLEDEEKYFSLKEYVFQLDKEITFLYSEEGCSFPSEPPKTLKGHVFTLFAFQFVHKNKNIESEKLLENSIKIDFPEIELKRIKDKIAMLIELGIIDHLINKYPYLRANGLNALRLTKLLSPFLGIEVNSLKKIINAFVTGTKESTDYPKVTEKVKNVIDKYTMEK